MTLIVLLFLYSTLNIIVEAICMPSLEVAGKINPKILLQRDLVTLGDLTTRNSYLNIKELASQNGYVVEEYKVKTEDGYILGLHRLTKNSTTFGTPVFLMHGLLDSSDSWILQGPDTALGYLLTDAGFDVWMGNARGNKYSSTHTELDPKEESFWKFSWEEIGVYDLPAMIEYVLASTDKDSVYYVGHSQGTTTFFVMNSLKPEYRRKIKMTFALSPIAWLSHAESPMLKYISTVPAPVFQYFQFFNTMTLSNEFLYQTYANMCEVITKGCGNIFEMLFGTNYFVSDAMLPAIVAHASSASVLQLVHYWQLYQSGRFCRFDHGWMRNLFLYGQFSPPDYDLSEITIPIALFFSGNDWLSHPADVYVLRGHLPHVISYYSQYFSHIDYMYASVAKDAVYDKIIKHIQDYERL